MTTLYVYSNETMGLVARIDGKTNDACEAVASDKYGDTDYFGWTYSPAFGANDGLVDNDEAVEIVAHEIRILRTNKSIEESVIGVADGEKVTDKVIEFGTTLRRTDPSICAIRLVGSMYKWMGHYTNEQMNTMLAVQDSDGNW